MPTKTEARLGIGELVERLQAECPEVTPSMVRFWEREGLLKPERTVGGHRKYTERDMERLRKVVELRQRRYLPLGVVKHILQQLDADPTYDLTLYDEIFRPAEHNPEFRAVTRGEAARQTGFTVEQIEQFEQSGFLPARHERGKHRRLEAGDLRILALLRILLDAGLTPEDLAFYVDDTREHVQHEIAFFTRVMGDCKGRPERHALYRQTQQTVGKLRALLYSGYTRQAIEDLLEGG